MSINFKEQVNSLETRIKIHDTYGSKNIDKWMLNKLNLKNNQLVLSVNSPDSGAADEELIVDYDNEELEIGFNAKYLQEIAAQVDGKNALFLFNNLSSAKLANDKWWDGTKNLYYVDVQHKLFELVCDSKWLDFPRQEWISSAHEYFKGNMTKSPLTEVLFIGSVTLEAEIPDA